MEITRNVILDLIPLYLAGEATDDTCRLVEHYLQQDPKLAKVAEMAAQEQLQEETPMPINKESEMQTFQKARLLTWQHHIFLALALTFSVLWVLAVLVQAVAPQVPTAVPVALFLAAAFFWIGFGNIVRQINQLD